MPFDTHESISIGTLNILEVIRLFKPDSKFYNASSSECFGDTGGTRANEKTPFDLKALMELQNLQLFGRSPITEKFMICTFHLEYYSIMNLLRPKRFVTQKIVLSAIDIYEKTKNF